MLLVYKFLLCSSSAYRGRIGAAGLLVHPLVELETDSGTVCVYSGVKITSVLVQEIKRKNALLVYEFYFACNLTLHII